MTRITIEVDASGHVTTTGSPAAAEGSQATPSASLPPASAANGQSPAQAGADSYGGAINAGSAPDHSGKDGPVPFHATPLSDPMSLAGAISAGPAPASVFEHDSGGHA